MRELHGVQRRLVAVEHHELGRARSGTSWRHSSRADRAAGAGDQHPPAGEVAGDRGDVGVDLVAAEQVGLGERADVADADRRAEQLGDGGQHPDLRGSASAASVAELAEHVGAGARGWR